MTSVFPNTPFLGGFSRIKFTIVGFCFFQMLTIARQQDPPQCDKYMDKRACNIVRSLKLKFAAEQNISVSNNVSCCFGHDQLIYYPTALALDRQLNSKRKKRGAAILFGPTTNQKWSLPANYYFSLASDPNSERMKSLVRNAINYITNETCITFNELTTPNKSMPYMNFISGQLSCTTFSGSSITGSSNITVASPCLNYFGDALNLLAQSLGLLLEFQRPDRDSYITINYANTNYATDFFNPNPTFFTNYYNSPYDYSSVMHPPPTWLAAQPGMITMQTKNPLFRNTIGQRAQFSFYDTQILNAIYCSAACSVPAPACQNGGYQDPRSCSKCKCPDGFTGDLCDRLMSHDTSKCGPQNITITGETGGVITSPGYADKTNYTTPIACTWLINAPANRTITLAFLDGFNVTCISLACYHWVEIRYISSSLNVTGPRFCCDTNPGVNLTSTGNQVLVLFRAVIPADSARGFQLMYTAPTPTCPFWDFLMNTNSFGASQAAGISTVNDCKQSCLNNPSCVAIDFDRSNNPPACWIHTSSSDLQSTTVNTNCDQYRLRRCVTVSPPTPTTALPPTPSSTMSSPAISPGCINWITNYNTNSYGASQNPSISTLDGCKQYCAATPSCAGIDFDHSGPTSTCWIHTRPNDFQFPGVSPNVDQYILTRSCSSSILPTTMPTTMTTTITSTTTIPTTPTSTTQSTTPTTTSTTTAAPVCPFWNFTKDRNSGGGTQAPSEMSTLNKCKKYCDDTPNCLAIDFDHSTNQPSCWVHTNTNDLQSTGPFPGCDQYRIIKCQTVTPVLPSTSTTTMTSTSTSTTTPTTTTTTPTTTTTSPTTTTTASPTTPTTSSTVCSTNWTVTEGLHSGNGVKIPGVQSESDCRNYCINMPSCAGVDFVWGSSPQECWVHTNDHDFDTLFSDSNVRQIRITNRCTPPTCQTNWITRYGIHSIGAQRVTTDSMVSTSDCLEYCSNMDNCYGVDVDMSASPSPACWVHTNLNDFSALYSDSNVNQYQLSNRCPPTNVTACQNGWVIRNGTHSMGGVKTANPLMIFDCLAYCAANPTCIGVDTNPSKNPPECWVYTDATRLAQKYQDGNMVQYELIARCPNNTLPQNTGGCGGSAATPGQMHPPCMIPRVPASSCDIYNLRLVFMGSAWSLTYVMTHGPCMVPTCNGVTQLINLNGELKCAVQGWTSWTPCSRSCGCGVQYRYYYSVFNNMYSTAQQNQQNCNCQRCDRRE